MRLRPEAVMVRDMVRRTVGAVRTKELHFCWNSVRDLSTLCSVALYGGECRYLTHGYLQGYCTIATGCLLLATCYLRMYTKGCGTSPLICATQFALTRKLEYVVVGLSIRIPLQL
jgi:hypothetical protein